jgi:integrase
MTSTSPSRNPFIAPDLPTIADLIVRVQAAEALPRSTRQNWCWALRAVARAVGKDLAAIPAHPEFLRPLLKGAAPASIGLTRPAWNNVRSLVGKVFEWVGAASMPAHYQAPFAPDWAELWDKLPLGKNALRMQLSRLFHFCSAQGIGPDAMNDDVLETFNQALVTESIVRLPYEIYRGAAKSWNNAAELIPDWPKQRLTVPSRKVVFCLPWDAFPPTLLSDVETYLRRAAGLDLSDDHFTRAQRPATLQTRQWQLQLLATAIHKSGIPLNALGNLRSILQPEFAADGLEYLRDRNKGVSSVQISHLAAFLPTLARRLEMPQEVISRLQRMKKKLKVTQNGMTLRNREALRAFDDPAAVRALLGFPDRILKEVQASGRKGRREAKKIQTALLVALLLNAPVRVQNLASIDLDRHLFEVGGRDNRVVHLRFPAIEVKNAADLEFPLMTETVDLLDLYLKAWRPLCPGQATSFLFPGNRPGRSKGKATLSAQIKELVFAYTRLDMPAHRFRHAVGKIFLDRNPGQYEVIRQLLGHKDIKTTIDFYAGAETVSAARHYHRTILQLQGHSDDPEVRP